MGITLALMIAAAAVGFVAVLCVRWWSFTPDDAFITLRYAQHLAAWHTLAWNPGGQPVQGFTSPLWTVLLAAAVAVGLPGGLAAKVGSLIAFGAAVLLCARIARRALPTHWALALAAAACSLPPFVLHAVSGMETMPYAVAVLWLADRALLWSETPARRNGWWVAAAAATVFFVRPEAALVAVVLCLALCRGRALRGLWWVGGVPALAAVGWLLFSWRYFGLPLPLSWYVRYQDAGVAGLGFLRWFGLPLILAALPLPKHRLRWLALPPAVMAVFYLHVAPLMDYAYRYDIQLWPLVVCAVAPSLAALGSGRRLRAFEGAIGAAGWLLFGLAGWPAHLRATSAWEAMYVSVVRTENGPLGRALAPVGRHLRIVVGDQGRIPFYSGAWSFDSVGLDTPAVALHGLAAGEIAAARPNVLIAVRLGPGGPYGATGDSALVAGYGRRHGFICVAQVGTSPVYALEVWVTGPRGRSVARAVRTLPASRPCGWRPPAVSRYS